MPQLIVFEVFPMTYPLMEPFPVFDRVRGWVVAEAKFAVTFLVAEIVTLQVVFVPVHAPDQFENTCPAAGFAVRCTTNPLRKSLEHRVPHWMVFDVAPST